MIGILDTFTREGFACDFRPAPDGVIECPECGSASDAARFRVAQFRRMEGASDPGEMLLIAALRCPHCDAGGTLVLTYGPEVTRLDAEILERLDEPPPPPVGPAGAPSPIAPSPGHKEV
jgi:hypothetical protein